MCVLVRSVYVCEGVGTGPERVSVRCVRDVYVWECLGLVVCATGGCVGPSECQVCRECACRSGSGADVSVCVRACWLRVQECCECGARLGGGRVCARGPGPLEGAVSGCVCVCVCVCACARVCGVRAPNKLSRLRPLRPGVGPGLRLAREEGGPAAADSDMSGCLLFRKFCAALAAGLLRGGSGAAGRPGRWR